MKIEPGRLAGWRSTGIGRLGSGRRIRPQRGDLRAERGDRCRRHRRRRAEPERPARSRRVGHRRDEGSRRPLHQDRRHRRRGPLRRARSSAGELSGLGPRLWPRRLRQDHQRAGRDAEPHREDRAERARRGAVLSGRLLVLDDGDSRERRVRSRQDLPRQRHARSLSRHHQEQRLRRLPSDRPALHPHDPGEVPARAGRRAFRRVAPSHSVRASRRADDRPCRGSPRRRAVQIFRRVDGTCRQGRIPLAEAAAAARCGAQHRRHAARLDEREAVPARPDRQRPPRSDGQRLWPAVRFAGIQLEQHPDPRPDQEHDRALPRACAR